MAWRRLAALGDEGPGMAGRYKQKDAHDIYYCELIFYVVKTREFNRIHNTEIVPVVIPILVVITHHAPVVASVQCMVDVRKLLQSHRPLGGNPDSGPEQHRRPESPTGNSAQRFQA